MNFLQTKIIEPLKGLLKQGMSPSTLALSLTAGGLLAVFPVFGITTLLCVAFAAVFGLNQIAIQLANYLAYPLQFLLFIPFLRLGERLFNLQPLSINPTTVFEMAWNNFSLFLELYGLAVLSACAAWAVIALPTGVILWKALAFLLSKQKSL